MRTHRKRRGAKQHQQNAANNERNRQTRDRLATLTARGGARYGVRRSGEGANFRQGKQLRDGGSGRGGGLWVSYRLGGGGGGELPCGQRMLNVSIDEY